MNFLSFLSGIFAPAAKLIDDVHVSDEERMQLKKVGFSTKFLPEPYNSPGQ